MVAVTSGMTITAAQIPTLVYTPAANANGAARSKFDFTVNDAGTGTVGATMTINVTAVNDVPVALASSVTTSEDTAKTFALSDFLFTDTENNPLASITVSTLSLATGDTLKVSQGSTVVAVTSGMTITAAQIPTLVYTPAANANGAARSTFDFTVNDAGTGTVAATMTINVTAVNDVPVALASSVTTSEDTAKTFALSDFLFTDTENNPLASITVSTLSLATGDTLKVSQGSTVVAVTSGMTITAAQIPTLVYTPAANANGAARSKFDFTVNDAGTGTVAATMTINVTSVNDAPVGTPKTITTAANTDYIFTATDFGFTDPNDSPANTLLAVKIAALPTAGSLTNNGSAVTAGQFIALADLKSGKLKFTPVFNASGAPYATFTFQVQDNGGTGNAGVDLDPAAKTIMIVVTPPPSATTAGVSGPAVGNYGVGQTLNFTVTYGAAVAVTGAPQLPLTIGGAPRTATYNTTSSTNTALVFSYPVVSGDNGAVAIVSPLLLNNGTIKNGPTDATLTFTPPDLTGVVVDTTPPTITIGTNKTSLALGGTAALTFTLSEASTNFSAADITVSGGTLSSFAGSGALYTATFTPTANSTTTAVIGVAAGTFTDATGNLNTAATPLNLSVNTVAPTLIISTNDGALAIGETATLTFTLSAASSTFTAADVTVSGGTLSNFAGSGANYTATFTPAANSTTTAVITVAAGTFTDATGNANTVATPLNLTVDTVAPTIGISSSKTSLALGETATLTFTLSEASTNFTAADVTVSGGTLSAFAGSGTGYSATFTPTADSATPAVIAVAAATFTDAAGNNNVAAAPLNLGVNTIVPRLAITSNRSALTLGQTATLTFTFTVAPTSFTAGDIQVSDGTNSGQPIANVGTVTNFTATSTTVYTALYTPAANLVATVRVTATAGQLTSTFNLPVNSFVPTVTIATNRGTLALGETANLTFTLSAASTDFTVSDIGVTGGTLSGFTPVSGTVYTATFTPTPLSTLTAVITVAAGSFTDAGGNANTAAAPLNLSVATDSAVVTWAAPAAVSYGTLLGDTQLNATANVDGTFVYAPLKGTKLNAGENQTLSVTFTPTDTVRYRAVTKTVALTVNKATPTVVWNAPANVQYFRPLTATQLNATIDGVAGTFAYTPALGSRSTLGVGQTLNVSLTFTPTDTANYNPATVAKAFPVVAASYTLAGTTATETETFPGRLSDYKVTYNSSTKTYTLLDLSHTPGWLTGQISNYEYLAFSDTTVTIVTPVVKQGALKDEFEDLI